MSSRKEEEKDPDRQRDLPEVLRIADHPEDHPADLHADRLEAHHHIEVDVHSQDRDLLREVPTDPKEDIAEAHPADQVHGPVEARNGQKAKAKAKENAITCL